MTTTRPKESVTTFATIERQALDALAAKGKADPAVVRAVRCRTVAEGRRFRHLNYTPIH